MNNTAPYMVCKQEECQNTLALAYNYTIQHQIATPQEPTLNNWILVKLADHYSVNNIFDGKYLFCALCNSIYGVVKDTTVFVNMRNVNMKDLNYKVIF